MSEKACSDALAFAARTRNGAAMRDYDSPRLTALLGPTNTGKTHLAMERMLGHASGMIGFPLRLLARENYDRAVAAKGADVVALITGEEKIVPAGAKYFLCTVEAMPLARRVAFLGLDEVQMCADADRGHVFTDRLLHARGMAETMFMGADTAAPLLRRLVPGVHIETRPRFSTLRHVGVKKITRLPKRSAIVAFSASDVYAIAELIRRQRGGAAVVLGALSPRTRNAQVALYQNGEVDYLVATDAIGMGLNMDVDHVAFAATRKFDGRQMRALIPAELGQIAGRAGRHMNDGTFGVTADIRPFDAEIAARIEAHSFDSLRHMYWRNPDLSFQSLDILRHSLSARPPAPGLFRVPAPDDERVLAALADDETIRPLALGGDAVRLLWEVCRIPDFRNILSDDHARLLGRIYRHLREDGALPEDWIANHVGQLDRSDGDIDTLSARIAHIRTWTYVAYHGDWLADAAHWQGLTRAVEDKLSDALHEKITQRFVDRRTSVLLKQMGEREIPDASVDGDGAVVVAGHHVGHLEGFRFKAERTGRGLADKAITGAALRALPPEIAARLERIRMDDNTAFTLTPDGTVLWQGEAVARLEKADDPLMPTVTVLVSDLLEAPQRQQLEERLTAWRDDLIKAGLEPLLTLRGGTLSGAARGVAFQMVEKLGALRRHHAKEQIDALTREDRQALRALGVRIGREHLYMPHMLKPKAQALTVMLWAINTGIDPRPAPPPEGRVSLPADTSMAPGYYAAAGFRVLGPLAIRLDMAERLAGMAWDASKSGPFAPGDDFLSLAGCTHEQLPGVLSGLGYAPRKPRKKKPAEETTPQATPQTEPDAAVETAIEAPAEPETAAAAPARTDATQDAPKQDAAKEDTKPEPVHYGRVLHKVAGVARKKPPHKKPDGNTGAAPKGPHPKAKGKGKPKNEPRSHKAGPKKPTYDPDSPFAKLKELKLGK